MMRFIISAGALSIAADYHSAAAAWDDAFERFGHIGRISVQATAAAT